MPQYTVNRADIDTVLDEARVREVAEVKTVAVEAIPDFCGIYRTTIRPILLVIIAFLKVINKAWADAVATVVAFADQVCPI